MSSAILEKKKTAKAQDLLCSLPYEKGFHFFTEHKKYTGITATSLPEFAEKLQIVPVESVSFHFERQDFQKWLRDTVGDEKLAQSLDQINGWPLIPLGEALKKELFNIIQNRIAELTKKQEDSL